jgi:hypothetical protein
LPQSSAAFGSTLQAPEFSLQPFIGAAMLASGQIAFEVARNTWLCGIVALEFAAPAAAAGYRVILALGQLGGYSDIWLQICAAADAASIGTIAAFRLVELLRPFNRGVGKLKRGRAFCGIEVLRALKLNGKAFDCVCQYLQCQTTTLLILLVPRGGI